jgi:hypothetical protein
VSAAAWGNWPKRLGLTVPFLGGARLGWNQDEHAKPIAPVRIRPALTNIRADGLGPVPLGNAAKPTDKATRQPSRVGFSGGVKGMGLLLAAFLLSICSLMLNALRQGRKPEPLGPSSGALVVLPDTQEYGATRASKSGPTGRELIHPALEFFRQEREWR